MQKIKIECSKSYEVLPAIKKVVERRGLRAKTVVVFYDTKRGTPAKEDTANWPLEVTFQNGVVLRAHALSAGYNGGGARDLVEILRYFRVSFDERDITTMRNAKNGLIYITYSVR